MSKDKTASSERGRLAPLVFLSSVWLGLLIGVSFLATPVKFQAPSIDLPTALDVGRVTFALFAKVEWVMAALLLAAAAFAWRTRSARSGWAWGGWACVAVIAIMVVLQSWWLLPLLDERAGRIMAGGPVPASHGHLAYVIMEGGKAVLLAGLSAAGLHRLSTERKGTSCA